MGAMLVASRTPDRLVILGGLGDLATRHLLPALAHLQGIGLLAPDFRITAVDRATISASEYRTFVDRAFNRHIGSQPQSERAWLLSRLEYLPTDLEENPQLRPLLQGSPAVIYLALPPQVYLPAARALKAGSLRAGSRIVIEKPFGTDRGSARDLNSLLHELLDEKDIFRADHFLYHQMIQDLLAARSSSIFSALIGRDHIEAVDLVWEESSGVAGRTGFYDANGALIDMVQSHLLEALTMTAMEPCYATDPSSIRDGRVELLRHVRTPTAEEVETETFRGRYASGVISGSRVRGYTEEEGVDPRRDTETLAVVRLHIDTPRWTDVPFTIRTGKRLGSPRREICLHLRATPDTSSRSQFAQHLRFSPQGIALDIPVSAPQGLPALVPARAIMRRQARTLTPSALLMLDVLQGNPMFCLRDDEVEECWRILEPVIDRWKTGNPPLVEYPAGSTGLSATNGANLEG